MSERIYIDASDVPRSIDLDARGISQAIDMVIGSGLAMQLGNAIGEGMLQAMNKQPEELDTGEGFPHRHFIQRGKEIPQDDWTKLEPGTIVWYIDLASKVTKIEPRLAIYNRGAFSCWLMGMDRVMLDLAGYTDGGQLAHNSNIKVWESGFRAVPQ